MIIDKNKAEHLIESGVAVATTTVFEDGVEYQAIDRFDTYSVDHYKISQAAVILGRKGGKVKSERKAKASRENGKLGGRPKKIVDSQNQRGKE